jgi:hypothetical protein
VRISRFEYAVSISAAALLAECGGSQPPIGAPGAMQRASAVTAVRAIHRATPTSSYYQTLHSFGWNSDSYWPVASLINVNGTFFDEAAPIGDVSTLRHRTASQL